MGRVVFCSSIFNHAKRDVQKMQNYEAETDDKEQEVSGQRGRPTNRTLTPMGKYILRKLAELHQTRQWLAAGVQLDPSTLTRIMYGDVSPRAEWLTRIAATLGVGYLELAQGTDAPSEPGLSGRVRFVAMQLQGLVDGLPEERAGEVLDQIESLVKLLREQ